jgi:hypothetical protein
MLPHPAFAQPSARLVTRFTSELTDLGTRHDVVRDVLWLANVGTNDMVYDLGSGDGRIVIAAVRDFGARRGVGIEIDPQRIRESRTNALKAGVASRVEFIQGDLFTNDFSQASVVFLYLSHIANVDLRSRLFQTLQPGTRVVSHQFGMGEWPPDKELHVRMRYFGMHGTFYNPFVNNPHVPDYNPRYDLRPDRGSTVSVWIVPAPIAGLWRGKVSFPEGERESKLVLHQRLSELTGSFQILGATNYEGNVRAELWGDQLRFECNPKSEFRLMFEGRASGDTIKGKLAILEHEKVRECQWEGRRAKADFSGTLEWAGPVGERPVRLRIEQRDGKWVGTYADPGWPSEFSYELETSITDFYDYGGGFYFTYLIGRSHHPRGGGYTLSGDPNNTGWLIGEAIVDGGDIKGTVSFYPYFQGRLDTNVTVQSGPRDWHPKRVVP